MFKYFTCVVNQNYGWKQVKRFKNTGASQTDVNIIQKIVQIKVTSLKTRPEFKENIHKIRTFSHKKLTDLFLKPKTYWFFSRRSNASGCDSKKSSCDNEPPCLRSNYHEDCEAAVNEQIRLELNAGYAYLNIAAYFGRTEVALPGFHGFFLKMYEEELLHAMQFLRYQNMRGGKVHLCPLATHECTEWDIKKALEVGLEMEKLVKDKLICAHDTAEKHHDLNLMDFIVTDFIDVQEKSICEFGRLLMRYNHMKLCTECGFVDFLMDKEVHRTFVKKAKEEKDPYVEELKIYK